MRAVSVALGALLLCACGSPAAVLWVRVEAPLLVPEQCDALTLRTRSSPSEAPFWEERFSLLEGPSFPLTLSLQELDEAHVGRTLTVEAEAFLGEARSAQWAFVQGTVTSQASRLVSLTLRMCDCER